MLFREPLRDRFAAAATVIELEEGMDSLLAHLGSLWERDHGWNPNFKADYLTFRRINEEPLIESFGEEWEVYLTSWDVVLGYTDREPRVIPPEERFQPLHEKEIVTKNHFETVWEYYNRNAIVSVPVDSNTFVMRAIAPETVVDGSYNTVTRVRGTDFRALLLGTRFGYIVYTLTTEHILNPETKHGIVAASEAIDRITQLTGYVQDDGLETTLSHIFGTGIHGDDYRPNNWGQEMECVLEQEAVGA